MAKEIDHSIRGVVISGSAGVAIGYNASAVGQLAPSYQQDVRGLLVQLRDTIGASGLAEKLQKVLLNNVLPSMERAIDSADAKSGLEAGLTRINDALEAAEVSATHVSGLLRVVQTVADKAGIALKAVAPFLTRLVGG